MMLCELTVSARTLGVLLTVYHMARIAGCSSKSLPIQRLLLNQVLMTRVARLHSQRRWRQTRMHRRLLPRR